MLYIGRKVKVKNNDYTIFTKSAEVLGEIIEVLPKGHEFDFRVKLKEKLFDGYDTDYFTIDELEFIDEMKDKYEEWLTTGQMIDQLEVGEIAENQFTNESRNKSYVYRSDTSICYCTKDGKYLHEVTLQGGDTDEFLKSSWRVLPKCVTFEEAKVALGLGKVIECEMPISKRVTKYIPNANVVSYAGDAITWDQIFNGKWTIKS